MKDYIDVYNDNGNKEQMEVVCTFNLEGYDYNYIIYKTLDSSHYYIGKYKGDSIVNLETNLSEKEFTLAEKILEGVLNND